MKKHYLYKQICALLLLLISSTFCNGQNKAHLLKHGINTAKNEAYLRDSLSLTNKHIRSILQDRTGNFWFATDGDGVCRYDGKSFTYFTQKDGLTSDYVWAILEDKTGNIWFGTRSGVCCFNGKSFTAFSDKIGFSNDDDYLTKLQARLRTFTYKTGDLLFPGNGKIYHFNGKSFSSFTIYPDSNRTKSNPDWQYSVYCVLEDKAGNLWLGTEQKGVCRYDGKSFTFFNDKGLDKAVVRSIYQDKTGNLWFGTNGMGVFRYDGKLFTNFTEEKGLGNPDFPQTLKSKTANLSRIWAMAEDKRGNLWFGTIDAGAWRYDGKSLTNFTTKNGLSSNAIRTIYKDKTGTLWFGTDGGVSKYDGKFFTSFTK